MTNDTGTTPVGLLTGKVVFITGASRGIGGVAALRTGGRARTAMKQLAKSYSPAELSQHAYSLYEQFRPSIPGGKKGWGAKGVLDLELVEGLRKKSGQ